MDDPQPNTTAADSEYDPELNPLRLQQEWLAASVLYTHQAADALRKATVAIDEDIPGRRPDTGLATAWAAIGQGWAALALAMQMNAVNGYGTAT